eukprot:scaffold19891_cov84-Phaeocystis_antarctica.AAC.2
MASRRSAMASRMHATMAATSPDWMSWVGGAGARLAPLRRLGRGGGLGVGQPPLNTAQAVERPMLRSRSLGMWAPSPTRTMWAPPERLAATCANIS